MTGHPSTETLIEALLDPRMHGERVDSVRLIETHISWVVLTGRFAYKIKKPVRLAFLDFSSLEKRRRYCGEELRLNRRLAPELYLEVISIGGQTDAPVLGGEPALEYAVKMREFPDEARLDLLLAAGRVTIRQIERLAELIAEFHEGLQPVGADESFGEPETIRDTVLENLDQVRTYMNGDAHAKWFAALRRWTDAQERQLHEHFAERKSAGAIREGHGDLHTENIVEFRGKLLPFDALEFDPALRWIDVINETAFLMMDLMAHGRADLALAFVNRYLERSGDYGGLRVLRYYLVYRALVRAKVRAIKQSQESGSTNDSASPEPYLRLTRQLTGEHRPVLLITHGLSGSGKTTVTEQLISRLPAIRVRSDLERKRLHGLDALEQSHSGIGEGLYTERATAHVYSTLERYALWGLEAGLNVIVDAAFLRRTERRAFQALAAQRSANFVILDCVAAEAELRRRIRERSARGPNVSEGHLKVLEHQLGSREPVTEHETVFLRRLNTEAPVSWDRLAAELRGHRVAQNAAEP